MNPRGANVVRLTFSHPPSTRGVDWALRDCLGTAIKLDGSRDIVTSAAVGSPGSGVEPLHPYGPSLCLSYRSSTHTVGVRKAPGD